MSSKRFLLALLCGSLIFNGVVFSLSLFSGAPASSSSNLPQHVVALVQHVARHVLVSIAHVVHGRSESSASALAVIGREAGALFNTLLGRIFTLTETVPGTDASAQSSSSLTFTTTTVSSSTLTDTDIDASSSSSQLADDDSDQGSGSDLFDTQAAGDGNSSSSIDSSDDDQDLSEESASTSTPLPLSSSVLPDTPAPLLESGGTFADDSNPETPIFVPSPPPSPVIADTAPSDDTDDTSLTTTSIASDSGDTGIASSSDDTSSDDTSSEADTTPTSTQDSSPPKATTSSQLIANFEIDYSPSDFTLHFSWQPGTDATATTTFTLTANASRAASSTQLLRSTSVFSYILPLQQLGLRRRFTLRAEGVGNVSQRIAQSITIPSFLDNVAFYPNPAINQSGYVFDMTVSSTHPLWDMSDQSNDQKWSAIVIARNGANFPPSLDSPQNLQPQGITTLPLDYADCNGGATQTGFNSFLLLPFNPASCRSAGMFSGAFNIGNLEDQRLILPVDGFAGALSADDSLNLALYTSISGGDGQRIFQLAEVDDTTYHPRESGPILSKPTTPPNVATQFDPSQSTVAVSWGSSTDDDTLDRTLTYEVGDAASDSSTADDLTWNSVGTSNSAIVPVVFDKSYTIGVRARDQFNKLSEATLVRWSFPSGFSPLPFQGDHDDIIGLTGGAQEITPMVDVSLSAVDLWISAADGSDCCSESAVQIRLADDSNTPGRNQGTSETVSVRQVDAPGQARYVFDTPILLDAGISYWIVPIAVGTDGTRIYGSLNNPYPDGFWNADSTSDAYFALEESPP